MKKKPTGFIAICQCGKVIGAMDYIRTDRVEAGNLLVKWLDDGCIIQPQFNDSWGVQVFKCCCEDSPSPTSRQSQEP